MKVSIKEVIYIYNSYIANGMQTSLLPTVWVVLINGKSMKGRLLFADKREISIAGNINIPTDNIAQLEIA
jgi:hypothetical protein